MSALISSPKPPTTPPTMSAIPRWSVRVLLAVLLMFGSEVLLLMNPLGRQVWEWGLLAVGYLLMATLMLDVMVRFKVRDLFGLMTVAGAYGLLASVLLVPQETLFDIPRTLISRVTGAQSLIGLEMLIVFLTLTAGFVVHLRQVVLGGAVAVGLAWGVWMRWSSVLGDVLYPPFSLETMLLVGSVCLLVIWGVTEFVYRRGRAVLPEDFLLKPQQVQLVLLVLVAVLILRMMQGVLTPPALLLSGILFFLCGAMLWFRKNTQYQMILVRHFPIYPLSIVWRILISAVFLWVGVFTYQLPLIGEVEVFNQYLFIVYGFMLYGIAWLPFISLILGVRAYIRQIQAQTA